MRILRLSSQQESQLCRLLSTQFGSIATHNGFPSLKKLSSSNCNESCFMLSIIQELMLTMEGFVKLFNRVLAALSCACFYGTYLSHIEATESGFPSEIVDKRTRAPEYFDVLQKDSHPLIKDGSRPVRDTNADVYSKYFFETYLLQRAKIDAMEITADSIDEIVNGNHAGLNLSSVHNAVATCGSLFGALVATQYFVQYLNTYRGKTDTLHHLLKFSTDLYNEGTIIQVDKSTRLLSIGVAGSLVRAAFQDDKYDDVFSGLNNSEMKSFCDRVRDVLAEDLDQESKLSNEALQEKSIHGSQYSNFSALIGAITTL
ncbi:MAG: hypothetical protein LBQ43_05030, partial [Holosporales bacterium]|nr:hypothetical protein [Holosporales bacterium]